MNIAILGWGSLIWCPGSLRIRTLWRSDGPRLPIEFARISQDDRLTLVIHSPRLARSSDVLGFQRIRQPERRARQSQASGKDQVWRYSSRLRDGSGGAGAARETIQTLTEWIEQHPDVEAVVWTGLQSNWQEKRGCPFALQDAMNFLSALEAERDRAKAAYDRAREYMTNAPSAVDTPVRQAMRVRGWHDIQLSSTLFESTAAPPSAPESPRENG